MNERYVGNPQRVHSHMAHFVLNPPANRENYANLIHNEIKIRRQPTKGPVIPNTKNHFFLKSQFKPVEKCIHFESGQKDKFHIF